MNGHMHTPACYASASAALMNGPFILKTCGVLGHTTMKNVHVLYPKYSLIIPN